MTNEQEYTKGFATFKDGTIIGYQADGLHLKINLEDIKWIIRKLIKQ